MRFGGWPCWVWLALSPALSGCGRTKAEDAKAAGGGSGVTQQYDTPRLLPWQLEVEGTEALLVGIFDSEQGRACSFLPDSAGQLRCLPLSPGTLDLTNEFADAECKQPIYRALLPVAEALRAEPLEPMALARKLEGCEQRYDVAPVNELAADAPHYVMFGGTSCGLNTSGPPPYLVGEVVDFARDKVVDPKKYVSGEVVPGALLGGRLRLHEVEAADGSRFQHALSDEHWQKPCRLSERRGSLECMPESLDDSTQLYVDMACEGDGIWYAEACADPAFIGQLDELYGLGEPWTGVVFDGSKTCRETSFSPDSGARFFQRGEPLGEDALATADWAQAGTELLELRGLRGEDDELVVLANWLFGDSLVQRQQPTTTAGARYRIRETGLDCAPVWTSAGEVRCVPSTAHIQPYTFDMFADASCSEPAYLCPSSRPCVGTDLVLWGNDEAGRYRALSRHAAVAVPSESVYSKKNDECVVSPFPTDSLFVSGDALPWDDYPLLSEVKGSP